MMLLPGMVQGQYNNNYWVFGDSAGVDWSTIPPTFFNSNVKMWRGSTSIGDNSGLIAYASRYNFLASDDTWIWNKYHTKMLNGDQVNGGGWYHTKLFLPVPGSDSLLYLISCCVTSSCPYGLYYTLIDLRANNDSGAVIQKNVPLNSYPAFDGLMAVQHGNGRDWWILFQRWNGAGTVSFNDIFVYLVDPSGITLQSQLNAGAGHKTGGGHLCFNSDGSRFSVVTWTNLIQVYNFDRCSGLVTSWVTIQPENTVFTTYSFSCSFSPNDSLLYVIEYGPNNTLSELHQYNLYASNILNSKYVVYTFPLTEKEVTDMKLAPDGKIYLTAADEPLMTPLYPDTAFTYINNNLSVINYPDSLGAACDFQPFSFNLGAGRTYYGLPNNPDYELGAWVGSPCDTLTTNLTPNPSPEARGAWMQAWYNHEWNMIHVNAAQLKGKKGMLRLFDMEGRVVFEKPAEVIAGGYYTTEINMKNLDNGVYVVNLVTEQEKISGKVGKY
jgi:hypothetical protein